MRLAVVGAGVAGSATAHAVSQLVSRDLVSEILLVERHRLGQPAAPGAPDTPDVGVGLWSNALRRLDASTRQSLEDRGRYIGSVGYRSGDGRWLARSELSTSLQGDSSATPSLLFLRQGDLVDQLREAAERSDRVRVVGGEWTTLQEVEGGGVVLGLASGESIEADAVVGADGPRSAVRAHVRGGEGLLPRGYHVYRGTAATDLGDLPSFQSWGHGDGMRFAAVPLSEREWAWFATHVEAPPRGDRRSALLDLFGGWHEEIAQLVKATPERAIVVSEATAIDPLRTARRGDAPENATLVGDAAHAADPVLAQGFTVAVEDAYELAQQLAAGGGAASAFRRYEAARLPRVQRLHAVSAVVQALSQPTAPGIGPLRDSAMLLAPDGVKRRVFDAVMRASLGPDAWGAAREKA